MAPNRHKQVMVIAGETSGDLYGSQVVEAIRNRQPDTVFSGMGGPAMAAAGVRILVDSASVSVVGITEVIGRLGAILKGFKMIKKALAQSRPDLLILIDFPDFNLRVARMAKRQGIRVLYYIAPTIWAWRTGRVRTIRKWVDHLAVILPFEADLFRAHAVPVTYVGNPLLDHHWPKPAIPDDNPYPLIGFLPGSRGQEVERHLPIMVKCIPLIDQVFKQAHYLVAPAGKKRYRLFQRIMKDQNVPCDRCEIAEGGARAIFPRCHLVIAASGTVTLEAAIAGVPMVVMYKVSPLSYLVARIMIKVKYISLVNLIAGREVVPELIQKEATAPHITREVVRLLSARERLDHVRQELSLVREKLGTSGATEQVADLALGLMGAFQPITF